MLRTRVQRRIVIGTLLHFLFMYCRADGHFQLILLELSLEVVKSLRWFDSHLNTHILELRVGLLNLRLYFRTLYHLL